MYIKIMRNWPSGLALVALLILMFYIQAGRTLAPFHGDEADQLAKSYDFVTVFIHGDAASLQVEPPVRIHSPEHIRMLTGTTTIYLTGSVLWLYDSSGYGWASPWFYAETYEWNVANGNLPPPDILYQGRIAPVILTMLAALLIFWLTFQVTPGTRSQRLLTAVLAAWLLSTQPAWLLNGRRVMQEAALGSGSLAVIITGYHYIERPRDWLLVLLSLVSGLCMAAKLTGFVITGIVFLTLTFRTLQSRPFSTKIQRSVQIFTAGCASLLILVLLTPAYWSAPVTRFFQAIELRQDVLAGQTNASPDAYHHPGQRFTAIITQPFLEPVQYYESTDFTGRLDTQIYEYEISRVGGWQMPGWLGWFWTGCAVIGLFHLIQYRKQPGTALVLVWITGIALFLIITVPVAWQRYYLPWIIPFCMLAAVGINRLTQYFYRWYQDYGLLAGNFS